jgi:alkaline phosphatase
MISSPGVTAQMTLMVCLVALTALVGEGHAAPAVTRLTPPSELFTSGREEPLIARFLPGQRFDVQATLRPDAGQRSAPRRASNASPNTCTSPRARRWAW